MDFVHTGKTSLQCRISSTSWQQVQNITLTGLDPELVPSEEQLPFAEVTDIQMSLSLGGEHGDKDDFYLVPLPFKVLSLEHFSRPCDSVEGFLTDAEGWRIGGGAVHWVLSMREELWIQPKAMIKGKADANISLVRRLAKLYVSHMPLPRMKLVDIWAL